MTVHTDWVRPGTWLEYSLKGSEENPVLVMVHELGLNLRQFEMQQQFFSKDFRVLLLSLRGHGHSSERYHATRLDYTIKSLAKDVQALLARLEIDRLHYVGNGLGGLVGFELLALNPDLFRSLTIYGTAVEAHISRISSWYEADKIHRLGPKEFMKYWKRSVSKQRFLRKSLNQLFSMTARMTLELTTLNAGRYDYRNILQEYEVPLLVLLCDLDRRVNRHLKSSLELFNILPGCEVKRLPGVGHFANLESPSAFDEALQEFLVNHHEPEVESSPAGILKPPKGLHATRKSA